MPDIVGNLPAKLRKENGGQDLSGAPRHGRHHWRPHWFQLGRIFAGPDLGSVEADVVCGLCNGGCRAGTVLTRLVVRPGRHSDLAPVDPVWHRLREVWQWLASTGI